MCSIFGALGRTVDHGLVDVLRENARDRGRDGGRVERVLLANGLSSVVGNWRATPTPEVQAAPLQPYDGLVHNGTIANDRALGALPGEVDSMVLARVLGRETFDGFVASLAPVIGSYALALRTSRSVYLACNYKPIYFYDRDGAVYFASMERHLAGIVRAGHRAAKLAPYSALDLSTGETRALPRKDGKRALVIASAGLDSTVVATHLLREGYDVRLLHFRYGCRAESRESALIPRIAAALGVSHDILPLPLDFAKDASPLLNGGAIAGAVEGAEFAHEWVPARNLVMLALATAYAEAQGFHVIALGNNLEESGAYPDNEEEFTHLFDGLLPYATRAGYAVRVVAPVGHLMKHEIVALGLRDGAPFSETWSCYQGGERHCGDCGPCFMRREAFRRNNAVDPVFGEAP